VQLQLKKKQYFNYNFRYKFYQNMDNSENSIKTPSSAKHDSGAADLEKVTDYAEEKEILQESANLNNAINVISDKRKKEADQKAEKEKELASVKVIKEEVEIIISEFELNKNRAERVLKENTGELEPALAFLINS
jgi:NACalpha-BTF3-like transcription factor